MRSCWVLLLLTQIVWAAPSLDVVDLRGEDIKDIFLILSLQGIVNRDSPQLYVLWESYTGYGDPSTAWLEYYKSKGWLTSYQQISIYEALQKYKNYVNGFVVYDPSTIHYVNVAFTMAGLYNVLVAHPDQITELQSLGIPLYRDLRGLWSDKIDAYRWQYDSLFPYCNKKLIVMAHIMRPIRDYAVKEKAAIIDLIPLPDSTEDYQLLCDYYSGMDSFAVVLGYPETGTYERPWVSLSSKYGLVCLLAWCYAANFSVHSHMPVADTYFQGHIDTLTLDTTKVYAAFMMTDFGLDMMHGRYYDLWDTPGRGSVPISWWLDPICIRFCPGIIQYYYETKTHNDYFYGAHGAGRIRPSDFIYLESFLDKVDSNLATCDLRTLGFSNHHKMDDRVVDLYTRKLSNCWGIYNGFGPEFGDLNAGNIRVKNDKIWCITAVCAHKPVDSAVSTIAEFVEKFHERPMFMPVMVLLWDTLAPDSLLEIKNRIDLMYPNEFEWVRADELMIAMKEFMSMLDQSDYRCDSIGVIEGTIIGGDYLSLHHNDGNYLQIASVWNDVANAYITSLCVVYHIEETRNKVKRLWLTYDGHFSTTCSNSLALWNYETNSWDRIGERTIADTDWTQEDGIIHNPWEYVNDNGEVKVLIMGNSDEPFTHYVDYILLQAFYYKVTGVGESTTTRLQLYQNPDKLILQYVLPRPTYVEIMIYNILGMRVRTLVNSYQPAGTYTVEWNGTNEFGTRISPGVYFCTLKIGNMVKTAKLYILR